MLIPYLDGNQVKFMLETLKYSQRSFAKRWSLSEFEVSRIVNGKALLPDNLDCAMQIAALALDIDLRKIKAPEHQVTPKVFYFNDRIRLIRKMTGKSDTWLAKELGVTQPTVRRWRCGGAMHLEHWQDTRFRELIKIARSIVETHAATMLRDAGLLE